MERQNESIKSMHEVLTELVEYKIVLEKANTIIHGDFLRNLNESMHSLASEGNEPRGRFSMSGRKSIGDLEEHKGDESRRGNMEHSFREVSIRYMAGTIDRDEIMRFKRLLFRATRGKI